MERTDPYAGIRDRRSRFTSFNSLFKNERRFSARSLSWTEYSSSLRRTPVISSPLCVVTAAFITPGADPTSLFALSVPLYFLFELSVVLSAVVYRRRLRKQAGRDADSGDAPVPV